VLQKQTEKLEEGLQEREHEHSTNIHTNITQQTYILTFAHLQKQTEKLEEGLQEREHDLELERLQVCKSALLHRKAPC